MATDPTPHTHLLPELLASTCKVLGLATEATSELELAGVVGVGLPHRAIAALIRHGIPERHIFRTIIPLRTYHRRRALEAHLSPEESDRAERTARLLALATLVFDDEESASRWLATQKRQFGGSAPLDLVASSIGAKVVEDALLRSYFGIIA